MISHISHTTHRRRRKKKKKKKKKKKEEEEEEENIFPEDIIFIASDPLSISSIDFMTQDLIRRS